MPINSQLTFSKWLFVVYDCCPIWRLLVHATWNQMTMTRNCWQWLEVIDWWIPIANRHPGAEYCTIISTGNSRWAQFRWLEHQLDLTDDNLKLTQGTWEILEWMASPSCLAGMRQSIGSASNLKGAQRLCPTRPSRKKVYLVACTITGTGSCWHAFICNASKQWSFFLAFDFKVLEYQVQHQVPEQGHLA